MRPDVTIRSAVPNDAAPAAAVIHAAFRQSNARDYAPTIIERLVAAFTPERVAQLIAQGGTLVAIADNALVGTASLVGSTVQSVFVDPRRQGTGIGAALMRRLEAMAGSRRVERLSLQSSLTAAGFYRRLGYAMTGERDHEGERAMAMEKMLARSACRAQ
jgi:GNAT superfamily N-acetyltransferase